MLKHQFLSDLSACYREEEDGTKLVFRLFRRGLRGRKVGVKSISLFWLVGALETGQRNLSPFDARDRKELESDDTDSSSL